MEEVTKLNVRWKNVKPYCTNPSYLTVEALFVLLTLCNVYVVHTLFVDIISVPLFVTWWQLTQGLITAWLLGKVGEIFPRFAYFPPVVISFDLLRSLLFPTISYVAMLCSANVLLAKAPTIAAFPILAAGAVAAHHAARFIACGEAYFATRWKAVGLLLLAFLLGSTDPLIAPSAVLTISFVYAILAAIFRAGCLESALHIVGGRGNTLHNHQHLLGAIGLPFIWIFAGEGRKIIHQLPMDPSNTKTWQVWGCFFTVGILPFIKNVISNRLIRLTGQAPWRVLELISVALLFLIGSIRYTPSWQAILATALVLMGRFLGALDVIGNMRDGITEPLEEHTTPFLERDTEALQTATPASAN